MKTNQKILVAGMIWASRRALRYVADIAGGNPACQVGLLHLEPPLCMLDWGEPKT